MSKIDKLSILGVRSFDNTRPETIQFYTPLTLIVGLNGSGKTTIIECLKYATTGDLPPNSRGGAFIHDPSLCGEKEVLAQVKMSFNSTSQIRMVVTRSLQLSVKKATRQQKTLEGSLLTVRHGERQSISTRVAELDLLMPQSLGVSKAILDSVIFCHQEESLWPMSEPTSLKKKFDEIFEALKYTKAIANIKDLRKEQGKVLQELRRQEAVAKDTKARADKAEKSSKELDAELNALRAEITGLQTQVDEAKVKSADAWEHCTKYQHIVDTLQLRKEKETWLDDDITRLRVDLQERKESDEWLQSELDNYEERVKTYQMNQTQREQQYGQVGEAIKQGREALGRKHGELGKYEQRKINYDNAIEDRNGIVRESSRKHKLRGFETDMTDHKINDYISRIQKLCEDQRIAIEKAQRDIERDANKHHETLKSLNDQKTKVVAEQTTLRQQVGADDQRLRQSRAEFHEMSDTEGELAVMQAKIKKFEEDLSSNRAEQTKQSWDKHITESEELIRTSNKEIGRLNEELLQATRSAGDLAQLRHLQKEQADRQRNLDKLVGVHEKSLQALLGHSWQPNTLEAEFRQIAESANTEIRNSERQRDAIARDLDQIDNELARANKLLKAHINVQEDCSTRLKEVAEEPENYASELAEIKEGHDTLKFDKEAFRLLSGFYEEAVNLAQSGQKCRLCARSFTNDSEKDHFVMAMRKKMKGNQIAELDKDLEAQEDLLLKANKLSPSYDTWLRLSQTDIPLAKKDIQRLEAHRSTTLRSLEEHDATVNRAEHTKSGIDVLTIPVNNIVKHIQDIGSLRKQYSEIETSQKVAGLPPSLEEVRMQLTKENEKLQRASASKDRLMAEKERALAQKNTLELNLATARANLVTTTHGLEKRKMRLREVDELTEKVNAQRERVRLLDLELAQITPQIETETARLEDTKERGRKKETTLRDEEASLRSTRSRLDQAEETIRKSSNDGSDDDLVRCQKDIEAATVEIQQEEIKQREIIKSINKIREELKSQKETKRTIEDTIKYRQKLLELNRIRSEVAQMNSEIAEADQQHWRREADRWQHKLNRLMTEHTSKLGTARAKDDQLIKLIEDWQTEYKDAAHKYKEAHIKVETTHAAVEDLGRYAGALDQAIMKYHSIKMGEINGVISELWRKTYQGTDVDTILIRSDNEAAKGNRTYNYRVSMVKQDAEMDMRGRCSAGQKVLASIIIRLALAECFGTRCGLIALDEPTTNLDRDNIRALAQSLHDLIQTRRHQANFQLIVITHDEEFLRFMRCPDFCDTYWRVARNAREKSTIEQQSIGYVM